MIEQKNYDQLNFRYVIACFHAREAKIKADFESARKRKLPDSIKDANILGLFGDSLRQRSLLAGEKHVHKSESVYQDPVWFLAETEEFLNVIQLQRKAPRPALAHPIPLPDGRVQEMKMRSVLSCTAAATSERNEARYMLV
jgi:hypothetical protein